MFGLFAADPQDRALTSVTLGDQRRVLREWGMEEYVLVYLYLSTLCVYASACV